MASPVASQYFHRSDQFSKVATNLLRGKFNDLKHAAKSSQLFLSKSVRRKER